MPPTLRVDNNHGLIFSSSVRPISGTVNIELGSKLDSYAILVSDRNSNEIVRQALRPKSSALEASFTWDLKSRSNNYVQSECYTVSLIDESKEIECCSTECKVIDTRNILSLTRSLKRSRAFARDSSQRLFSIYFDIIEDIETLILERLKDDRFEEPYAVACITAGFIQDIANDIQNPRSRFLGLIEEFGSKHPMKTERLGLWTLFDFLVNYMSDTEDQVRANAMVKCGQCHLTQNDKSQIVSSMVSAMYPYCKTITFPRNVIGSSVEKISEGMIKLGIKYLTTKHINRSISICRAMSSGNSYDIRKGLASQ